MGDLVYSPTTWVHGGAPAIDADKLNNIESGIANATAAINLQKRETKTFAFAGQPGASLVDGDNGFFTVSIPGGSLTIVGVKAVGISGSGLTWKIRRYTSGSWSDIIGTTASPKSDSYSSSALSTALVDGDRIALFIVASGSAYAGFEVTLLMDRTS